jgi:hypothetical protein
MLAMGRNHSLQQSGAKTVSQTLRRPRLERQSHGFSPVSSGRHRTLGTGNSFRFPSSKVHRFHNPGTAMIRVVWITSPPLN